MESLSSVVVLFTAVYAVAQRDSINPGLAGLVITYSITVRTGGARSFFVVVKKKNVNPRRNRQVIFHRMPCCCRLEVNWRWFYGLLVNWKIGWYPLSESASTRAYKLRWVHANWGGYIKTGAYIQIEVGTYKLRWVHTNWGGYIQTEVGTYKLRWIHTNWGAYIQTEEDT